MCFFRKTQRVLDVEKIEREQEPGIRDEMEKGDLLAMLISAFLVFTPVILLLIAIVWGLYWLFTH
ncbi:MAG TPA: hypothetical protein PLX25_07270 [Sphaerochaeta sp.]|nr:hypothetical protein [Sphaerochaeta sp.]HPZ16449.1 hypothetical protein [Sphaerochaeta sp.]